MKNKNFISKYQPVDTRNDRQMVANGLRLPILFIERPINQKSEYEKAKLKGLKTKGKKINSEKNQNILLQQIANQMSNRIRFNGYLVIS